MNINNNIYMINDNVECMRRAVPAESLVLVLGLAVAICI